MTQKIYKKRKEVKGSMGNLGEKSSFPILDNVFTLSGITGENKRA